MLNEINEMNRRVKPMLGQAEVHALEQALWKAHTTPDSLGADIPNMARAAMDFFGFRPHRESDLVD
jgi:hypothetical protein